MATTTTPATAAASNDANSKDSYLSLPKCQILMRSKDGVEVFSIPSSSHPASAPSPHHPRQFVLRGPTTFQVYSPNGQYVYLHQSNVGVVRCSLSDDDDATKQQPTPFLADSQPVQIMTVSPLGTYLLTWERYRPPTATSTAAQEGGGSGPPNLKVWNATTGAFVWGTVQKNLKREGWPYMQWTHDEAFAMLMLSSELRVYRGQDLAALGETKDSTLLSNTLRFVDRIPCPGIVSFSIPNLNNPNKSLMMTPIHSETTLPSYYFTCFCTKTKDQPARISLHVYPPPPPATSSVSVTAKKTTTSSSSSYPALVSKSSNQADECHIHWNPKGDACLASLQTSVDTSGESYYGSSTLLLLRHDATEAILVPLPNATTNPSVSDVSWMPNPHTPPCFLVISGKMPTTTSLHHGVTADPLYMLGQGHRNTSAWAPHGRFFALAGFGNLAGGVSLWDRNKLKPMDGGADGNNNGSGPQVSAPCTVGWGWSPDSRIIFTSVTSPRRNVDNGVRIFRYNGVEITNMMPWNNVQYYHPDKLYQASFVPSHVPYPDRPQSPKPRRAGGGGANESSPVATSVTPTSLPQPTAAATTLTPPPTAAAPKGRYVPPSARGRPSDGSSLAERMRRESQQSSLVATKAVAVVAVKSSVPGMAPIKKSIPGLNPPSASSSSKKSKRSKPKTANATATTTDQADGVAATSSASNEAKAIPSAATTAEANDTAAETDPEKRGRKLKKILKQIEDLKSRPASELNEDQQKKVASEQQLREELAQLEV
jgi:translation initiation factor 2A